MEAGQRIMGAEWDLGYMMRVSSLGRTFNVEALNPLPCHAICIYCQHQEPSARDKHNGQANVDATNTLHATHSNPCPSGLRICLHWESASMKSLSFQLGTRKIHFDPSVDFLPPGEHSAGCAGVVMTLSKVELTLNPNPKP